MEYVHKSLGFHKDIKNLFLTLGQAAESWFTNTATFIRKDQKVL